VSGTRETPQPGHGRYRDDLAAYALGALPEGEAAELRAHLERCEECRKQLRWLQPAVDLLPRSVPQVRPPKRLRNRLMRTVRAEARAADPGRAAGRRRRDWQALLWRPATAAAAGVLLAAGAGAGYLLHQPSEESSVIAGRAAGAAPSASGQLERTGGTGILRVQGMPRLAGGHVYEVWVRRDGSVQPSSLFSVRDNRSGEAAVPGPLEGADAVLVTREPSGGSPQPTSRPVLSVNLR
jgi:anti-sigma-K factor RskA